MRIDDKRFSSSYLEGDARDAALKARIARLEAEASLEAFRHGISVDDRLVLVGSEAELPPIEEEDETEDYLVADEPLDIRDLVEDAVLLALPMVPRKPGLEGEVGVKEAVRKESPFAALARLKKDK